MNVPPPGPPPRGPPPQGVGGAGSSQQGLLQTPGGMMMVPPRGPPPAGMMLGAPGSGGPPGAGGAGMMMPMMMPPPNMGMGAGNAPGSADDGPPGGDSDAPPGSDGDAPPGSSGNNEAADMSAAGALNQTIYVNNLSEKVAPLELKRSLYAVFKRFGKIIDIHARKTYFLRGQAWIIFDSVEAAKNAVIQMQGFPLFDKKMRIKFATATSDVIAKTQGTYKKRPKRKRVVPPPSLNKAAAEGGDNDDNTTETSGEGGTSSSASTTDGPTGSEEPTRKKGAGTPGIAAAAGAGAGTGLQPQQHPASGFGAPPLPAPVYVPPNKILLAKQLPDECTKEMLEELFQKFPNFVGVRFFKVKHAAFIDYTDESSATAALQALSNFSLSDEHTLNLTYANK